MKKAGWNVSNGDWGRITALEETFELYILFIIAAANARRGIESDAQESAKSISIPPNSKNDARPRTVYPLSTPSSSLLSHPLRLPYVVHNPASSPSN